MTPLRPAPTLSALACAALLAAAPGARAMEQELNELTGAVYRQLQSMTLPTERIGDLTLNEINRINQVVKGDDSATEKRRKVLEILEEQE